MPVDAIETPTESLRREITTQYSCISGGIAYLSTCIEKRYNDGWIRNALSNLKACIVDLVNLCSFNDGFVEALGKSYTNFKYSTTPVRGREYIRKYAIYVLKLWERITLVLRKQKIIILPSE
ncbi:hypothetical protein EQO05_00915 [Methanosarcina sp. MSH10X1]|uniref:hypothetical protein n=1 Tax=Methanosarcina sp. MSH10X1 TaxID=2507075 RepID=UPI000FFCAFFE|nr:hypothetical protein [Methanosarcina sp. MSH10X1]RXA21829.1 hypothetical protein EQO05_00915 [Methanosarcina sp. MSH10X1]